MQIVDDDTKIDFAFIHELEGNTAFDVHVPESNVRLCGVTLAYGFDLGSSDVEELRQVLLTPVLIGKLYPYLGRKGDNARTYLQAHPLTFSENEKDIITRLIQQFSGADLCRQYAARSEVAFTNIPACWQTVIASMSFCYGKLSLHQPTFWKLVCSQSWQEALSELRNLRDANSTRHSKEVDYIERLTKLSA